MGLSHAATIPEQIDVPMRSDPLPSPSFNLAQAVHRHALSRPDALALSCEQRSLSYGELARQAAGLAGRLRNIPGWSRHGGDAPRVGILASRSAEACIAVLGAAWAGATYVPLGPKLPQERLLTILSLCKLSAIVTDEQGARLLSAPLIDAAPPAIFVLGSAPPPQAGTPGVTWLDAAALGACEAGEPAPFEPTDVAYVIFTSGTTGVPKGVMIPASAIRHYIETITAHLGLRAGDRALETCELTFDVSLHNMFTTWEAGASLHVLPSARAMNAVKFARERELTVWNSVPSLAGMLRQLKALSAGALPRLRLTVFGGEQLTRGTVEAWRLAAPGSVIYNLYGPTEATVYCLAQRVDEPLPLSPGRPVLPLGRPRPGREAAVLDPGGKPVADGTPGELALAGVQLARGYLDAPELTGARFVSLHGKRWYLTGDIGIRDPAGNFHCMGRIDNQIKLLGHRVELEEVDAHLRLVAGAAPAAAVPWRVVDGSPQGLVASVGGCHIQEAPTIEALKARLPPYMVPGRVIPIETMPINASGKIDRKALRQLLENGMA